MKQLPWLLVFATACSTDPQPQDTPAGTAITTLGGTSAGDGTTGGPGGGVAGDDSPADETVGDGGMLPKFDLADAGTFCEGRNAGVYCDDKTAVLCDDDGAVLDTTNCIRENCVEGEGCVVCTEGQYACQGPRVMACNTEGEASWREIELCDPAADEVCDVGIGACTPLAPIGGTEPTGVYYQYAVFEPGEGFTNIADVDSFGNRIYFIGRQGNTNPLVIGAYDVTLLDSDGDGALEPNQHPDNPDETGPVEERTFTFVEAIPIAPSQGGRLPTVMELHATETTLYYTGAEGVHAYDLATGNVVVEAGRPSWLAAGDFWGVSFLGFDDINDVWYAGNESDRRVFQYDAASASWGWSFQFPPLAGDHMDGVEVVTQASTGIPFVYVSDMTSNFIGQYRLDPKQGWVQENLFSYAESTGALVEGFGYGALDHFWVGSGQTSFYELGGGDLSDFIGPEG